MQIGGMSRDATRTPRKTAKITPAGGLLAVLLGLVLPCLAAQAADDDYLKMLEAEATGDAGPKVDAASVRENTASAGSSVSTAQAGAMDRAAFEAQFGQLRPSTFSAYEKLEEPQKQSVFEQFRESGDYNKLVLEVMRLRYGQ